MPRVLLLFLLLSLQAFGAEILVSTNQELKEAIKNATAGDIITMTNGVWNNAEIKFSAKGTKSQPITLRAQEKGKVTLEKSSNLKISGEYLIVEGLVFKNGFSPTSEVISFRKDSKTLAYNCRLTQVVIDNFNGPERYEGQAWAVLYGKNNRVDHCSFLNKRNKGVTLTVRLNSTESVENNHLIDHNYFGPRQNLGSNGGETIRIGTSHYSMMNSKSIVEYNFFERCDGEHEIISNKSGQNIYRFNTFLECKGTLTLRHGNETLVEGNVFIGNGVPNSGGIRVINEKQTVINNYLEGLTGNRFRGALTVMNGVPNSPLNRYVSVKDSKITNNTVVNCEHIELCAGSDTERSETPTSTLIANNLISSNNPDIFGIFDDITGLTFNNNLISPVINKPVKQGFTSDKVEFKRADNGLLVLKKQKKGIGAIISHTLSNKLNSGAAWYISKDNNVAFNSGKTVNVKANMSTLEEAISTSSPGDIIQLEPSNTYTISRSIVLRHPLTIKSNGKEKANLQFASKYLFQIENGGSLKLEDLSISGNKAPSEALNSVITTSATSMNKNYKLIVNNCDFHNLDENKDFNVLNISPSTFADSISFTNSTFSGVSGDVLALNKEKDDKGIYNAEVVVIESCSFKNIKGSSINMYRGGTDESTTAGVLVLSNSAFENVGKESGNILIHGVQQAIIKSNTFKQSGAFNIALTVGEPRNIIEDCVIGETQEIHVTGEGYSSSNLIINENY